MKLLVINGPNINLLGVRETDIYGEGSYEDLKNYILNTCVENSIDVEIFQSNHEDSIVDKYSRLTTM